MAEDYSIIFDSIGLIAFSSSYFVFSMGHIYPKRFYFLDLQVVLPKYNLSKQIFINNGFESR